MELKELTTLPLYARTLLLKLWINTIEKFISRCHRPAEADFMRDYLRMDEETFRTILAEARGLVHVDLTPHEVGLGALIPEEEVS